MGGGPGCLCRFLRSPGGGEGDQPGWRRAAGEGARRARWGSGARQLISLVDGDNSFRVRVLGRRSPGVLHLHDLLDAEALVASSFVSGGWPRPCRRPIWRAWLVRWTALLQVRSSVGRTTTTRAAPGPAEISSGDVR
ncbi:DUF5959 family protein [Kitasatospora sp. NPDC101157]|uniref:DUF5959 family protein n=1 Tax=Kitasatospora sp. NPDC101157 TaxID=3364098 RepID=UPI0038156895